MAEFQKVSAEWARMCAAMQIMDGCNDCPITKDTHNARCIGGETPADIAGIDEIEKVVLKWSKENPEPVYPTWEEWLQSVGVMENVESIIGLCKKQLMLDGVPVYAIPTRKVLESIPADIAEKLGIQAKGAR